MKNAPRDISVYKEFFDRACISWDNYSKRKVQLNFSKDVKGLIALINQQLIFLEKIKKLNGQVLEELEELEKSKSKDTPFKKTILVVRDMIPEYVKVLEAQKVQLGISFECYNDESRGTEEKINDKLKRLADTAISEDKDLNTHISNAKLRRVAYTGFALILLTLGTFSSVKGSELLRKALPEKDLISTIVQMERQQANVKVNIMWTISPDDSSRINNIITETIRYTLYKYDSKHVVKEINVIIGQSVFDDGIASYDGSTNTMKISDNAVYTLEDYDSMIKYRPDINESQKESINLNSSIAVISFVSTIAHETVHAVDYKEDGERYVSASFNWSKISADTSINLKKMNKVIEENVDVLLDTEKNAVSFSIKITEDFFLSKDLSVEKKAKILGLIQKDKQRLERIKSEVYGGYKDKWITKGLQIAEHLAYIWAQNYVKVNVTNVFTLKDIADGLNMDMNGKYINPISLVKQLEKRGIVKVQWGKSSKDTIITLK